MGKVHVYRSSEKDVIMSGDRTFAIIGSGRSIETIASEVAAAALKRHPDVGGVVTFEGRVRDHHRGRAVTALEYSVYRELADHEGMRIVDDVAQRLELPIACAIHRVGPVPIGDLAVWVFVGASHRAAAFEGCRAIIDEIKRDVPIWKHEWYGDGTDEWVIGNPG